MNLVAIAVLLSISRSSIFLSNLFALFVVALDLSSYQM